MKMGKLKGVQCVGPLSVHSELCLKSGHMTKELLKFKNVKKSLKTLKDNKRDKKTVCDVCLCHRVS